jgi:hypothetical protein
VAQIAQSLARIALLLAQTQSTHSITCDKHVDYATVHSVQELMCTWDVYARADDQLTGSAPGFVRQCYLELELRHHDCAHTANLIYVSLRDAGRLLDRLYAHARLLYLVLYGMSFPAA